MQSAQGLAAQRKRCRYATLPSVATWWQPRPSLATTPRVIKSGQDVPCPMCRSITGSTHASDMESISDASSSSGDAAPAPAVEIAPLVDPRITDLTHFRSKQDITNFNTVPAGSFTRIRSLGEGVNGVVQLYRRRQAHEEIKVAVKKVVASTLCAAPLKEPDEWAVHRGRAACRRPEQEDDVLSEIGVLTFLSKQSNVTDHLLRLHGAFRDSTHVWVVTELAEGGELFQAVSSGRVAGEAQAKRYTREIAIAVEFLHRHHIGHRDVSLENTLLTREGSAKVMDFGMAARSHSSSGEPLRFCRLLGKEGYRAPECYVPRSEEVAGVLCPEAAKPGDIRSVRACGSSCLIEVRIPTGAEPGKTCKAAVWGYALQPADIFAVGVCFFMMAYSCPFFRRATLADGYFAWLLEQGDDGLEQLVRSWGKAPMSPAAMRLLESMVHWDPSARPTAAGCLSQGRLCEAGHDVPESVAAGGA